jgi:hypothetical protein
MGLRGPSLNSDQSRLNESYKGLEICTHVPHNLLRRGDLEKGKLSVFVG